jgi:hypothetical protein
MACEITYEELSAFTLGDLSTGKQDDLREHIAACASCRERVAALADVDAALEAMPAARPSCTALLATRRALAGVTRGGAPEVMTLEEVADFLRIGMDDLDEIVEELPAFELGGQIRCRRESLLAWIERREREFSRQAAATWAGGEPVLMIEKGAA